MAGFNDKNRSFTGVFMVSYMLIESLKYAKKAKFILVFEESNIMQSQIDQIIRPFMNFVNLFKHHEILKRREVLSHLLSSVVLVNTKADKTFEETLSRLDLILAGLMEEQKTENS